MRGSSVSLSKPCGFASGCKSASANPLFAQPLPYGIACGKFALQFFVGNQSTLLAKSTKNILPGCKRPFSFTIAGSTGNTPTSLAMITRSSCVM